MYDAFLDQTKKRISAVKKHTELSQVLLKALQGPVPAGEEGTDRHFYELIASSSPDRVEWRLIEHCSLVTRLYALYEQFSQELIREHLLLLQNSVDYASLPPEVRASHRRGMAVLFDKNDSLRYRHLSLTSLVEQFGNALSGRPYLLEPNAFLMQEQNLRLPELHRLLVGCGIDEMTSWIERHPLTIRFFSSGDRLGGTAEHEMRELIKYRNEAAHGSIQIDHLPGADYLYEFCDFISVLCEVMAEKMHLAGVERLIDAGKAISCGKVKESLKDGKVIIGDFRGDFEVGSALFVKGTNYFKSVTIDSLRIDDHDHQVLSINSPIELGIGISSEVPKRSNVFQLVRPPAIDLAVGLDQEGVGTNPLQSSAAPLA